MSAEPTHSWLLVQLRAGSKCEEFLVHSVKPYVDTVMQTGMAESFSYVRHLSEPQSLRLYFKGPADVLQHILQPNTFDYFHPLIGRKGVQAAPYRPCLEMYGGITGHFLSMLQYRAASEMALYQLDKHRAYWNRGKSLEIARRLHSSLFFQAGLTPLESADLCQLMWTARRRNQSRPPSMANQRRYRAQETLLAEQLGEYWHLQASQPVRDTQWQQWHSMNQIVSSSIQKNLALGKIKERAPRDLLLHGARHNHGRIQWWSFLADFVCLMNNRLGILEAEEDYLLYSLAHSLRELTPPLDMNVTARAV